MGIFLVFIIFQFYVNQHSFSLPIAICNTINLVGKSLFTNITIADIISNHLTIALSMPYEALTPTMAFESHIAHSSMQPHHHVLLS